MPKLNEEPNKSRAYPVYIFKSKGQVNGGTMITSTHWKKMIDGNLEERSPHARIQKKKKYLLVTQKLKGTAPGTDSSDEGI